MALLSHCDVKQVYISAVRRSLVLPVRTEYTPVRGVLANSTVRRTKIMTYAGFQFENPALKDVYHDLDPIY
jgi:hypothetical protein